MQKVWGSSPHSSIMDKYDELGSTKCHFCEADVPKDPEMAKWSLVPRYNKAKYKGKKYVWRCPKCFRGSQTKFLEWLYPGEKNPENTFGREKRR